jgi:hypothetical protein
MPSSNQSSIHCDSIFKSKSAFHSKNPLCEGTREALYS